MRLSIDTKIIATVALVVTIGSGSACEKKERVPTTTSKKEKLTGPPIQMAQTKAPSPVVSGQSSVIGSESPDGNRQPPVASPSVTSDNVSGAPSPPVSRTGEAVPFAPHPVKTLTQIELLLDGSGSMSGPIEAETKIDVAKGVLKDLLTQPAPPESKRQVGLRVFGTQRPPAANQCDDTIQLAPMGPIEAERLGHLLDGVIPKGMAPLAYALEQAANDFPAIDETDNVIILVADGADNCQGDPCAAAEKIHASPKKIIIHAIGFDLDQKGQEQLRCIANKADGQFYLARTIAELRTAVDQAANANLPYNFRLKILAGATPLPAQVTVTRAGTDQVIQKGMAPGMKFFQLPAGSYDMAIEYADSIEAAKPTKTLKGVEIQTSTRAEQIVQFELGQLTLAAIDATGQWAQAEYDVKKAGTPPFTRFTAGPAPKTFLLTPGTYDITVSGLSAGAIPLAAAATNIAVRSGETREQTFRFETGQLFLRAQADPDHFVKALYTIPSPDRPEESLLTGEVAPEGTAIPLPTGRYSVVIRTADPDLQGLGTVTLEGLEVFRGAMTQQLATFSGGTLILSGKDVAKDNKGSIAHTEFQIRKTGATETILKAESKNAPVQVAIAPGTYDIVALNMGSNIAPAPSILWKDIVVKENAQTMHEALFQLGELKLAGKNAKGSRMSTIFTVFRVGTGEPLGTLRSDTDWVTFRLTPGLYDVRAEDGTAKSDPKPTQWFHGLGVAGNSTTVQEATFSSGKLKIVCRGPNNVLLECEYRIFTYGTDHPLFMGATGEKAPMELEVEPGKYYLEAGYHDPHAEQLLKKWINITIADNEILEQVIRF